MFRGLMNQSEGGDLQQLQLHLTDAACWSIVDLLRRGQLGPGHHQLIRRGTDSTALFRLRPPVFFIIYYLLFIIVWVLDTLYLGEV